MRLIKNMLTLRAFIKYILIQLFEFKKYKTIYSTRDNTLLKQTGQPE